MSQRLLRTSCEWSLEESLVVCWFEFIIVVTMAALLRLLWLLFVTACCKLAVVLGARRFKFS